MGGPSFGFFLLFAFFFRRVGVLGLPGDGQILDGFVGRIADDFFALELTLVGERARRDDLVGGGRVDARELGELLFRGGVDIHFRRSFFFFPGLGRGGRRIALG